MICISVTPESRKLARVDLFNASRYCDLIELCLDKLIKEPDVAEMMEGIEKPILVSCRRKEEGGQWEGTEDDRLKLLRSAIVAGPAYVELDMETAAKIPRFGETKRVISHTSLNEPLKNVDEIYEQAVALKADVVKFTWPTPTLEHAWPLLVAVSKKRNLPTVGIGLGRSGLTFSLLGQRYGSPWIYAALERGMEAYPGQPTVWDLKELYGIDGIEAETRFVGITGIGATEPHYAQAINQAFDSVGAPLRSLPLTIRAVDRLEKMLNILKVQSMLVGPHEGTRLRPFAVHAEKSAEETGYTDLLLHQSDGWNGFNTAARAILHCLESHFSGEDEGQKHPLDRRNILLIGSGGLSQAIANAIHVRQGVLSISSPDDKEARTAAEQLGVRFVPFAKVYDTLCDVVVITAHNLSSGYRREEFNPGFFRPSMTVLDLSRYPGSSSLVEDAEMRGATIIDSSKAVIAQLAVQFKAITGKDLPIDVVRKCLETVDD